MFNHHARHTPTKPDNKRPQNWNRLTNFKWTCFVRSNLRSAPLPAFQTPREKLSWRQTRPFQTRFKLFGSRSSRAWYLILVPDPWNRSNPRGHLGSISEVFFFFASLREVPAANLFSDVWGRHLEEGCARLNGDVGDWGRVSMRRRYRNLTIL